jgi:SWI/SNF-related matrix-associated actin-dependent regulator of chromatin subfamily A containing DEAD/H box 1
MRRTFEEISDDEWSQHNFKSSRVLKRPHRSTQPPTQPPPPIDSFRYDPKAASATSSRTATVVLSDDDDLGVKDRARRTVKLQPVFKRPQPKPASRAPPSKGSFRNNPKPSKAAAARLSGNEDDDFDLADDDSDISDSKASRWRRSSKAVDTSGLSGSDDDEFDLEDDDSDDVSNIPAPRTSRPRHNTGRRLVTAGIDISDEDEDLGLADDFDYKDPRPLLPQCTTGRRFVIEDDNDSDEPVTAGPAGGADDDEINWSELENEDDDDDDDDDQDYNNGRNVHVKEDEGDVVGMALRKCSRISVDLRKELYGSSARNCDSYAEIDSSTCRIVTQVQLVWCMYYVVSAFSRTNVMIQWYLGTLE